MLIEMANADLSEKLTVHAKHDHAILELKLVAIASDNAKEYGVFSSGGDRASDVYIFGVKRNCGSIVSLFNADDEQTRKKIYQEFLHKTESK